MDTPPSLSLFATRGGGGGAGRWYLRAEKYVGNPRHGEAVDSSTTVMFAHMEAIELRCHGSKNGSVCHWFVTCGLDYTVMHFPFTFFIKIKISGRGDGRTIKFCD
jgi:hypothetical protein